MNIDKQKLLNKLSAIPAIGNTMTKEQLNLIINNCEGVSKEVTPVLMSADNPDGYKLEDLLVILRKEVIEKNNKIKSDKSHLSIHVQVNNQRIIWLLSQAEKTQRYSYELMAQKAPDQGPTRTPRIGKHEK